MRDQQLEFVRPTGHTGAGAARPRHADAISTQQEAVFLRPMWRPDWPARRRHRGPLTSGGGAGSWQLGFEIRIALRRKTGASRFECDPPSSDHRQPSPVPAFARTTPPTHSLLFFTLFLNRGFAPFRTVSHRLSHVGDQCGTRCAPHCPREVRGVHRGHGGPSGVRGRLL